MIFSINQQRREKEDYKTFADIEESSEEKKDQENDYDEKGERKQHEEEEDLCNYKENNAIEFTYAIGCLALIQLQFCFLYTELDLATSTVTKARLTNLQQNIHDLWHHKGKARDEYKTCYIAHTLFFNATHTHNLT